MKRLALRGIALLCGVILLFSLTGCIVIDQPEPLWEKEAFTGERKRENFYTLMGVSYWTYNDDTAEAVGIDQTTFTGTSLILPETVEGRPLTEIADGAFEGSAITQLELPDGLVSIGARAFRQTGITKLELPDSLTRVGEDAFDNCRRLTSVRFGKGLKTLPTGMFFGCAALKEVTLPEGVEVIGEECFSECTALEKVTLPASLREIGPYAFWSSGTEALSFDIPDGVGVIGAGAFRETAWLASQTDTFVIAGDGVLIRYNGTEIEVTVPESVKCVSDAFTGTTVKKVILPVGVKECENAWEETPGIEIIRG